MCSRHQPEEGADSRALTPPQREAFGAYMRDLDRWADEHYPDGGSYCARCDERFTPTDERAEITQLPYGTHPSLVIHQSCMTDQDVVA